MTRIDFYFNVADKFRQVAELAGVALTRRRRLLVLTPDSGTAARMEAALWSHPPTGFLPHCRSAHPLAAETPILVDWAPEALPHHDILINLTPAHPRIFTRFQGLIEVVGQDEADRAAARERFRFYRDLGYDIRSHDTAKG